MSALDLLIDDLDGRLHAAVIHKTTLDDLQVDGTLKDRTWGAIYVGKVTKIDQGLNAAIVELGDGTQGLLQGKHVRLPGLQPKTTRPPVGQLLQGGQTVLVQVKSVARREAGRSAQKLPRLTMNLQLFGQYVTHHPALETVLVSRDVSDEAVLDFCRKLKGKAGWNVHAAAAQAKPDDIKHEAQQMLNLWRRVTADLETAPDTPRRLLDGPDSAERVLNEYGSAAFNHIYAGNKEILKTIIEWCKAHEPALADSKRLRLFKPEKPGQTLFDIHDVHSGLMTLDDDIIPLNDGGWMAIDYTRALVTFDVNKGAAETVLQANLDAAREIGRQLRLRNISGAILVDFISMNLKSERLEVFNEVQKTMAADTLAQPHGFTRLGILEITRKRRTPMLAEIKPHHG